MDINHLSCSGDGEGAPLIDLLQDAMDDLPEIATDCVERSVVLQEPTPTRGSLQTPPPETLPQLTINPARSIRELVELLGSPVHSSTSASPRASVISRRSITPPSPSIFNDPVSFREPEPEDLGRISPCAGSSIKTSDTVLSLPVDQDSNRTTTDPVPPASPAPEQSVEQTLRFLTVPHEEPASPPLSPSPPTQPVVPTWLDRPPSPRPPLSPINPRRIRLSDSNPGSQFTQSTTIPPPLRLPAPSRLFSSTRALAQPWTHRDDQDPFTRPDRFSRTTAHTTISDILFNFDLDSASAAELIADACETARQVGVSTCDLLSRSVFLGTSDLGVTPLCLEASRLEVDNGLELVIWLIENTRASEVYHEVQKGCLMRRNGMGEQSVWNVLRGFVPDTERGGSVAYDVEVEGLGVVPGGGIVSVVHGEGIQSHPVENLNSVEEDSDDDGSLYDDVSIIDAESGLDQADIETLKSSSDESEEGKDIPIQDPEPEPVPSRVHRARIVMPSVNEYLVGPSWAYTTVGPSNRFGMAASGPLVNKIITAEWIYEGRLWALSIGQDSLVLTLRRTSSRVSSDPIELTAIVRILPLDMAWTGVAEIDHIGSDGLLPTQAPNDELLSSPLYECEFGGREVVPGPGGVGSRSSVWRTDIRVSSFTLFELVGPDGGFKVEVVVRVREGATEREVPVASASVPSSSGCGSPGEEVHVADDASDWQFVDD